MEKTIKRPKFSLVLKMNDDNIIIERFFNVKEFNPETIHSLDLTYTCDWIKESIIYLFKKESMRLMWLKYDEYAEPKTEEKEQKTEKYFILELRYGKTLINSRIVDVTFFPKEVTENVYLKEVFPNYIQELTNVLSIQNKELTRKYLKQNLANIPNHIRCDYRKIKNTFNSFKND